MRNIKKGFTLIELIVVIAILAALSALALPTFSGLIEYSSRMVDVSNAKSIQRIMTLKALDGTIIPPSNSSAVKGFWVLVCRDGKNAPGGYGGAVRDDNTVFCGTDDGVKVDGTTNNGNYLNENAGLRKVFDDNFGGGKTIKCKSNSARKADGVNGWDWYIVEFYWKNGKLGSRVYSGKKNDNAGISIGVGKNETTIERYLK